MLAPAGQATARAGLRSKLAALVVRRQAGPAPRGLHAPETPKAEVGCSPEPPLPETAVRRGRACPARNLPTNPFHGQSVGEGFIPPAHLPIATHHTKKDAQPLRSCVLYFYASFFMALLIGPLTAISTAASAKLTTRYTGNIPVSGRSNRAATRKNTSVSST